MLQAAHRLQARAAVRAAASGAQAGAGMSSDGPMGDAAVIDAGQPDGEDGGPPTQRRSPDEVLVVSNANSPVSMDVASDYVAKRKITNVLSVSCADSATSSNNETIQVADYKTSIAGPVQQYLAAHPNINFIVLTKGIPIRINGADTGCCANSGPKQPSLDSYLAAIDYPTIPGAVKIGITGSGTVGNGWLNRYWNANARFTHSQFGGYLVTRLDGYTAADAKALVTRSLSAEHGVTGTVLLDAQPDFGLGDKETEPAPVTMTVTSESAYGTWNADMMHAHDILEASGIQSQLDLSSNFVGGLSGLAGYFSWGSNDSHFSASGYEGLTFAPGSISDTAVSTSGRTFLPTSGGQSLLVDLIAHGLTAGKGYTGEPLLQGVASPTIAMDRYVAGYTMAESLYAASRFTGWEDVVIGDPLCAPYADAGRIAEPIQASAYDTSSPGVQKENCSEGGQDVHNINNAAYTAYHSVALTGGATFVARVASGGAGGSIEVHLDGAGGTKVATCAVAANGNNQTWVTTTCPLAPVSGTHDVYLVFAGGGDNLFSVEWFAIRR
jgi:uncharacterized protein (TIGR03790 family)